MNGGRKGWLDVCIYVSIERVRDGWMDRFFLMQSGGLQTLCELVQTNLYKRLGISEKAICQ